MTLEYERYYAIANTRNLLVEIMTQAGPIKKTELREKARRLLKHYPEEWWTTEKARQAEQTIEDNVARMKSK